MIAAVTGVLLVAAASTVKLEAPPAGMAMDTGEAAIVKPWIVGELHAVIVSRDKVLPIQTAVLLMFLMVFPDANIHSIRCRTIASSFLALADVRGRF